MGAELLKGFRMLDLADEKGAICGKILADLGADVIKVEPPQGCSTRTIPPFVGDHAGPDGSAYALAYHAGKRSVTLNLEAEAGRDLLRKLATKADFLVESFAPGFLAGRGLGYAELAQLNPRLIYTSIMPFGDRGPARNYKAPDLVTWAAGGMMFQIGEEGRPPLQMAQPQAGLHAGAEAAVASLIAHYSREVEGRGQHAVVNMQACVTWTLMNEQAMPLLHGNYLRRSGVFTGAIGGRRKTVFKCKDGYVSGLLAGGAYLPSTNALIAWMKEEGAAPDWLAKEGGLKALTPAALMVADAASVAELERAEAAVEAFFLTRTKTEIWQNILKRRILAAPVATAADIAVDPQLKAREYFVEVAAPSNPHKITLPGAFAKLSETPIGPAGPPPRIGEHNTAVYGELLGYSPVQLAELRETGAI